MVRNIIIYICYIFTICSIDTAVLAKSSLFAVTPTGRPDMVFKNTLLADAISKITNLCMDYGLPVNNPSDNDVTCEVHLGVMKAALSQALLGNNYSTTPQEFFKFHFAQIGENTRVQGLAWIETQMAFGQIRRAPIQNDAIYNNLMSIMSNAGAEFLIGTRFPNYPYLGALFDKIEALNIPHYKYGYRIKDLKEESSFKKEGVIVGDILIEINGNVFKNDADFAHALNKVDNGKKVTFKFLRGDTIESINIITSERPTIQS